MTKKKKIVYGLVLVLGLLALLVDRLMVTRPQRASGAVANAAATQSQTALAGDLAGDSSGIEPVAAASFPRITVQDLPTGPRRDAFRILPAAIGAMGGRLPADADDDAHPSRSADGTTQLSTAQFVSKHRLSAVLDSGGFGVAVIDGQWIKMGDSLDACKLTEITGRQATFECYDGAATLEVAILKSESYAP